MSETVDCFACGRTLENIQYEALEGEVHSIHPCSGLHFRTYGHYGSTTFDPMDGTFLDIAICDICIVERSVRLSGTGAAATQNEAEMLIDAAERHG